MPTPYLKKLSKEGKGSLPALEKKWNKAGEIAKKEGREDDYAYRTGILKNMVGAAIKRLCATSEIDADSFEGWINTLQYEYTRPEGADYVIVNAPEAEIRDKLYSQEWNGVKDRSGDMSKGEHQVNVKSEDENSTRITSVR